VLTNQGPIAGTPYKNKYSDGYISLGNNACPKVLYACSLTEGQHSSRPEPRSCLKRRRMGMVMETEIEPIDVDDASAVADL
jgi:hypothetical protein